MFIFLLSDHRKARKRSIPFTVMKRFCNIVPNVTFLLSLGCLCSNPDRKTRIRFASPTYILTGIKVQHQTFITAN